MPEKKVEIKVGTVVDDKKIEALEATINKLRREKIELDIQANTSKLEETESRIKEVKSELESLQGEVDVDDSRVKELSRELESLESEKIDLEIAVETGKLESARAEVEEMDGEEVHIDLQMEMQNFSQGIIQAKQGLSELKDAVQEVEQAGVQSEQNLAFLELNLGADKAKKTMQEISEIVAKMPGDDNTMRSVLSTAQALGNNLDTAQMEAATKTMADYMAGSATMGKQAVESQQDIMKYLLDGNTAELERGSIVSAHVDKLKEANTFMERQQAMQEVLNELGYGGISQVDTMINKQAEWDGMIYNSQDALSSMWLGAEKGAMDYILKLNEASNGMVGMGIVAGQMVGGPLIEVGSGLGQMAVGMKALKDLNMIKWLKELTLWTKLEAAANWILNASLWANPVTWVVIAIIALIAILVIAYYKVDWFREMVDNAWVSLQELASGLLGFVSDAINNLSQQFQNFTNALGLNTNDWQQAILGFILFIPTLPAQLGLALTNALMKAMGFKTDFITTLKNAASQAVSNFISVIGGMYTKFHEEVNKMLEEGERLKRELPKKVATAGTGVVGMWAASTHENSPGLMYYKFKGEIDAMESVAENTRLPGLMGNVGSNVTSNFGTPSLLNNEVNNSSVYGGNGVTINLEIGSVDNEDRVNEIVEAVRKALAWDNRTAGRTV